MIFDSEHSGKEDRFILLGISSGLRVLVVCQCYVEDDMVIRILSTYTYKIVLILKKS